jgi:ubiquitin C-terminal hydrolase
MSVITQNQPQGLINIGNSCYANSILQALIAIDTFISSFASIDEQALAIPLIKY